MFPIIIEQVCGDRYESICSYDLEKHHTCLYIEVLQSKLHSCCPVVFSKIVVISIIHLPFLFFFSSICIKQQLGDVLPQLVQLEEGLAACNMLSAMKSSPALWEPVFVSGVAGPPVDANLLLSQVEAVHHDSQMKREKETDAYMFFCDFVHRLNTEGTIFYFVLNFSALY